MDIITSFLVFLGIKSLLFSQHPQVVVTADKTVSAVAEVKSIEDQQPNKFKPDLLPSFVA